MRRLLFMAALTGCQLVAQVRGKPAATAPTTPSPAPASGTAPTPAVAHVEGENTAGIPPLFIRLVRSGYEDVASRNNNYSMLRPAIAAFDAKWEAFADRKRIVDGALAKVDQLEKADKLADAQAVLEALLPLDKAKAEATAKRALVEARDADVPALLALARIANARKSPTVPAIGTLVRVAAALWSRREVKDRDSELLLWLAKDRDGDNRLRMWEGQEESILLARRRAHGHDALFDGPYVAYKLLQPTRVVYELVQKQATSQLRWPTLFEEAPALTAKFEQAWKPYRERAVVVAAAIASGKPATVIVPIDPVATRGWIEAYDAEWPAIAAHAEAAKAQQDWRAFVVDVTSAMWSRRPVRDADIELAALYANKDVDGESGKAIAKARLDALDQHGLTIATPEGQKKSTKGSPILMQLPVTNWQNKAKTLTAAGKQIKFKMVIDAQDAFCKKTNRIKDWYPDGTPRYEEECTYKPRKDTYLVDAALREAAPAWTAEVTRADKGNLYVVGKLVGTGGPMSWKLQDALILDLRFMQR